jgi:hypothetical protein
MEVYIYQQGWYAGIIFKTLSALVVIKRMMNISGQLLLTDGEFYTGLRFK